MRTSIGLEIYRGERVVSQSIDITLLLFLSIALIISVIIDIRYKKIPNLITFPAVIFALIYYFITKGFSGLLFSLEGLVLGMLIFAIPYIMGGMGAGDVKLMGAVGAFVGYKGVFVSFIYTAVFGGLYAIILLIMNYSYTKAFLKRFWITLKTFFATGQLIPIPAARDEKRPVLCYGVAIALGALLYLYLGWKGQNINII
jgi:prepilin peptidase CpaA